MQGIMGEVDSTNAHRDFELHVKFGKEKENSSVVRRGKQNKVSNPIP